MESIKEIYRKGHGPSSSHTMGPKKTAEKFKARNPGAKRFEVVLYGSLAATGSGEIVAAPTYCASGVLPAVLFISNL
ncbi:MAG TPA: hypothetical protein ENN90_11225 [Mariniphaga anaerophila]|uniref:L-serine ammonia-lyase n=1 Tax=Mariniphaga anaerophila TaxID=1484053 RepID=A0A831LMI8_9BACT|nr:hypothetical protein [Mariniphaga anaerophila]